MKRRKIVIFILSILLIKVVTLNSAMALEVEHVSNEILEKKTFNRWPDPIVADCGLFPSLLGKNIALIRLYSYTNDTLQPIPFQIDEKDSLGNRIYPSGKHANQKDGNGLMDQGEELVFMARDSGHKIHPDVLLPGIEIWQELELKDPLNQAKGWVYIFYSESNLFPMSDKDYIIYIPVEKCKEGDCQVIKSRYMEDHFYPIEPYADLSKYPKAGFGHMYMSTPPEAGGTGVNYVDRLKIRTTVALFFGLIKFSLDENNINMYEIAYKDGPVRLIRNIRLILDLPLKIKAPGAVMDLIWYDTMEDVPLVIDLPINPGLLYTYLELNIAEDRAPGAIGMRVYNSNNPKGCLVDGKMDQDAEIHWKEGLDEWRIMTGSQGTIMNRSFWDKLYLKQMRSVKVAYIDDIRKKDKPEDDPGILGMIRQTNRLGAIKKGRYRSYLEWYWIPGFLLSGPDNTYRIGDEKIYLNVADHPVQLRADELTMTSHYIGQMPSYEQAERTTGDVAHKK